MGIGPLQSWFLSACHGDLRAIKRLLAKGKVTNIDIGDYMKHGYTALHHAAVYRQNKVVKFLLDAKACANKKENRGFTPLHLVALTERGKRLDNEQKDIITMLLKARASVKEKNLEGRTPLHCAAEKGNAHCVQILIQAKADVDVKDICGRSPFDVVSSLLNKTKVHSESPDPDKRLDRIMMEKTIDILQGREVKEEAIESHLVEEEKQLSDEDKLEQKEIE
eukprot:CAMPEP_0114529966 /NCGR_PEP_ID=MMETSP0109-20121206/25156_1 /TAXON_ID=29199 /ORGANISM="Chlorarachnion reptans, Strain CCCM449" /LENGTH=221 /DNA_ID=CAMNT_0001712483 /DNA_START=208 /DNA_END=873 /DNA_ORIENTATION=+